MRGQPFSSYLFNCIRGKIVKILTCSTGSLSKEMSETYGITIVPYYVIYRGKTYKEDFNFDRRKYYQEMRDMKELPTTSHPSLQDIDEPYSHLGKSEAIYVTISSVYTKTYELVASLRERFKDLRIGVYDTKAACGKQGILAVEAARFANEDKSMDEILEHIKEVDKRSDCCLIFNTLEYVAKGGRIGKTQSLLGTTLSIKPIIGFRDGTSAPLSKVKTHEQGLNFIITKIKEDMERFKSNRIRSIIEDSDNCEWSNKAKERLKKEFTVDEIWQTQVSAVSGTHIGPGCWGITYYCL